MKIVKRKIKIEEFDSIDSYLDAIIYEARRQFNQKKNAKDKQH